MNLRDAKRMVYEQELNYEREKNEKPDDYKYYNPKNFTTNPERIYKIIDEIEKTRFRQKKRRFCYGQEKRRTCNPPCKG